LFSAAGVFVVESSLHALHDYLQAIIPGGHYLGLTVFYVFDLGIITVLFATLFYYLPDAKIAWRDVMTGAILTAVLFVVSKFLLGLYLASGAAGSAYGAASSLVTLLLWIFYSAQIFLFGAEFTKVYAETYGSIGSAAPLRSESREKRSRAAVSGTNVNRTKKSFFTGRPAYRIGSTENLRQFRVNPLKRVH
jgi:uncharacterized BrkB/YihY/UPF0761 family membrane protein